MSVLCVSCVSVCVCVCVCSLQCVCVCVCVWFVCEYACVECGSVGVCADESSKDLIIYTVEKLILE